MSRKGSLNSVFTEEDRDGEKEHVTYGCMFRRREEHDEVAQVSQVKPVPLGD